MNTDKLKALLLKIEDAPQEFTVILSGKKSKKVNGLYKPDTREIILHNKNFEDNATGENLLVYTAIHEYAHHIQACRHNNKISVRAHSNEFWAIFHALLDKAESRGIYHNSASDSPELAALTETIQTKFIKGNGSLVKELGRHLFDAHVLCDKAGVRFEDYLDRILCIPRLAAKMAVKMFEYDLDPATGADNMRFLAGIGNAEKRGTAEQALLGGKSPDLVKLSYKTMQSPEDEDTETQLKKEKQRLERSIAALEKRLEEVKRELGE